MNNSIDCKSSAYVVDKALTSYRSYPNVKGHWPPGYWPLKMSFLNSIERDYTMNRYRLNMTYYELQRLLTVWHQGSSEFEWKNLKIEIILQLFLSEYNDFISSVCYILILSHSFLTSIAYPGQRSRSERSMNFDTTLLHFHWWHSVMV